MTSGRTVLVPRRGAVRIASSHVRSMGWEPAPLRLRPVRLLVSWVTAAAAVALAAAVVPGFGLAQSGAAFAVAAAIALLNALVPLVLAALRLPFMLVAGFLLCSGGRRPAAAARQ